MSEFRCKEPRSFFVSAFIALPLDKVEKFTGMASVVNLGVENLEDFKFGFVINNDGRQRLNSFRDWAQECCVSIPYNESLFPGVLPAMMSTTTNRGTLQYKSMGVRHDRT